MSTRYEMEKVGCVVDVFGTADRERLRPLVAELVAARRARPGWTQERVAACLRVSASAVRNWESLEDAPSMDNLVRWAEVLGFQLVLVDRLHVRHRPDSGGALGTSAQNPVVSSLIAVLRAERLRCGIPQLELSVRMDVTEVTVNRWELNTAGIRVRCLMQWAELLDCAVRLESTDTV